jgi:hypothetical protein
MRCSPLHANDYVGSNNGREVRAFEQSETLREDIANGRELLDRRGIVQERASHRPRTVTARRVATILFESSVIETEKQGAKVERLQNNCASKAYRYENRNWGS